MFLTLFLLAASTGLVEQKALDEFVNLPDSHYKYNFLGKKEVPIFWFNARFHTINMTSQKWLDESEVDKPVWQHNLTIVKPPKKMEIDGSCILIVTSGQNDSFASSNLVTERHLAHLAFGTRALVALLEPIPFQPLNIKKHPLGRKNITDYDILAYSWWSFLNDSNAPPHRLLPFPMVKATVRAMDTITDFMKKSYRVSVTRFTLAGISMNGWIPWLTAAVDKRVVAIIPVGMDFLNFTENFRHHYRAYCGWSYMLRPFHELNITQKLDDPRFKELASHVDPLEYNERYTNITKYIIIASGDEYFQPDNSHYYFPQLQGKTAFNIIPNIDYRFPGKNALFDPIFIFYYRFKFYDLPSVSWQRVTAALPPKSLLFSASNVVSSVYLKFLMFLTPIFAPPSSSSNPVPYDMLCMEVGQTNTTGIIYFNTSMDTYNIFSYHADSVGGSRRDFRMRIAAGNSSRDSSVKWIQTNVDRVKWRQYKKEFKIPAKGWKAFFIQAVYPKGSGSVHLIYTSEIHIIPDTFPCPPCNGEGCRGMLV